MSRKSSKPTYKLPYWCAGTADSTEPIFIQMGATLMQHPAFLALTSSDRWCYQCMILEAKGKPDFQFSRRTAENYGIANRTLIRNVEALVKAGFIDVTASGKAIVQRPTTAFLFAGKLRLNRYQVAYI